MKIKYGILLLGVFAYSFFLINTSIVAVNANKTYESYEQLITNDVLQQPDNTIQVQKSQEIIKAYATELQEWIKKGKMPLIQQVKIGENTISIYGAIQKVSTGGNKEVCGPLLVNGEMPGYPFCLGIVQTKTGVSLQIMTSEWTIANQTYQRFMLIAKDSFTVKNGLAILLNVAGDFCDYGITYTMFDKNLQRKGELSIGGNRGCEGGGQLGISKTLYRSGKKRIGSISWSMASPININYGEKGIRTITINNKNRLYTEIGR